jgi:hypothetical protein
MNQTKPHSPITKIKIISISDCWLEKCYTSFSSKPCNKCCTKLLSRRNTLLTTSYNRCLRIKNSVKHSINFCTRQHESRTKNWILEKQRGWPSKSAGLKKTRYNSLTRYVCCTLDVRFSLLPLSLFDPPGGSHFETPPQKAVTRPYGQFLHGDGTTSS